MAQLAPQLPTHAQREEHHHRAPHASEHHATPALSVAVGLAGLRAFAVPSVAQGSSSSPVLPLVHRASRSTHGLSAPTPIGPHCSPTPPSTTTTQIEPPPTSTRAMTATTTNTVTPAPQMMQAPPPHRLMPVQTQPQPVHPTMYRPYAPYSHPGYAPYGMYPPPPPPHSAYPTVPKPLPLSYAAVPPAAVGHPAHYHARPPHAPLAVSAFRRTGGEEAAAAAAMSQQQQQQQLNPTMHSPLGVDADRVTRTSSLATSTTPPSMADAASAAAAAHAAAMQSHAAATGYITPASPPKVMQTYADFMSASAVAPSSTLSSSSMSVAAAASAAAAANSAAAVAAAVQAQAQSQATAAMSADEAAYYLSKKGSACLVCYRAKTSCDGERPCFRCVRLHKTAMCEDRPKEERHPRGKRKGATSSTPQGSGARKRRDSHHHRHRHGHDSDAACCDDDDDDDSRDASSDSSELTPSAASAASSSVARAAEAAAFARHQELIARAKTLLTQPGGGGVVPQAPNTDEATATPASSSATPSAPPAVAGTLEAAISTPRGHWFMMHLTSFMGSNELRDFIHDMPPLEACCDTVRSESARTTPHATENGSGGNGHGTGGGGESDSSSVTSPVAASASAVPPPVRLPLLRLRRSAMELTYDPTPVECADPFITNDPADQVPPPGGDMSRVAQMVVQPLGIMVRARNDINNVVEPPINTATSSSDLYDEDITHGHHPTCPCTELHRQVALQLASGRVKVEAATVAASSSALDAPPPPSSSTPSPSCDVTDNAATAAISSAPTADTDETMTSREDAAAAASAAVKVASAPTPAPAAAPCDLQTCTCTLVERPVRVCVSREWERLFGYTQGDLRAMLLDEGAGAFFTRMLREDSRRAGIEAALEALVEGRHEYTFEAVIVNKWRAEIRCVMTVRPSNASLDPSLGVVGTLVTWAPHVDPRPTPQNKHTATSSAATTRR